MRKPPIPISGTGASSRGTTRDWPMRRSTRRPTHCVPVSGAPGGVTHGIGRLAPPAREGWRPSPTPPARTVQARSWPRIDGRRGSVVAVCDWRRSSQRIGALSIQPPSSARPTKPPRPGRRSTTTPTSLGHQARAMIAPTEVAGPASTSASEVSRPEVGPRLGQPAERPWPAPHTIPAPTSGSRTKAADGRGRPMARRPAPVLPGASDRGPCRRSRSVRRLRGRFARRDGRRTGCRPVRRPRPHVGRRGGLLALARQALLELGPLDPGQHVRLGFRLGRSSVVAPARRRRLRRGRGAGSRPSSSRRWRARAARDSASISSVLRRGGDREPAALGRDEDGGRASAPAGRPRSSSSSRSRARPSSHPSQRRSAREGARRCSPRSRTRVTGPGTSG